MRQGLRLKKQLSIECITKHGPTKWWHCDKWNKRLLCSKNKEMTYKKKTWRGPWIRQPGIWRHVTRLKLSKYAYLTNNKTYTLDSRDSVKLIAKPTVNQSTRFTSCSILVQSHCCSVPLTFLDVMKLFVKATCWKSGCD